MHGPVSNRERRGVFVGDKVLEAKTNHFVSDGVHYNVVEGGRELFECGKRF